MSIRKMLIGGVLLLLSVPAGYALFIGAFLASGGIFGDCGIEEVERRKSQDGRFEAMVYMHDCGATTRATWRVALASSDDPEAFEDIFGGDVRGPVQVEWTGSATLSVKAGAAYRRDDQKIYIRESEWSGVQIQFVNMDLPSHSEQR